MAKAGSAPEENDDAYWPSKDGDTRGAVTYRAAVADGATESAFAGLWAHQLVDAFGREQFDWTEADRDVPDALAPLQTEWARVVSTRQLPWFAEEKARAGAFATFLGMTLSTPRRRRAPGRWHAWAVGDSCLAQVRGEKLVTFFPIRRSAEFGSRPVLLSSNPAQNGIVGGHVVRHRGTWCHDDRFLLMTDALAAWFLQSVERNERPWSELRDLETDAAAGTFGQLVDSLRAHQGMRNDDTTLLRIEVA